MYLPTDKALQNPFIHKDAKFGLILISGSGKKDIFYFHYICRY